MAKFLFVYRSDVEQEQQQPSPEEMQAIMQEWGAWFQKVGAAMVDGGDGLMPTGKTVRGSTVTDGPFIEAKELVGGYSVVEADNIDAAVGFAKSCPIIGVGGCVEIRQLAGLSDQM
jgi:hypothetical protein